MRRVWTRPLRTGEEGGYVPHGRRWKNEEKGGGGLAVPSPLLTRIFFAYGVDHHDTICDWLAAGDII